MRFGQKKEIVTDNVEIDLSIDLTELNREIMDQPLLYKKYSDLDAASQKAVKMAELQLARVKAEAHLKHSQKGLKVKDVDSMVDLDPVVIEVSNKLLDLQETADKIRGIVRAFNQRHDSLKDLAANQRREVL